MNVIDFFKETKAEAKKIKWAQKSEVKPMFIMVMIMVVLFSAFFAVVDWGIYNVVDFMIKV